MTAHEIYMKAALNLAARGIGNTGSNPTVGCVVVKDGVIIAEGRTAKGGRPHAESLALGKAGKRTKGATIYVTLEPCSHHGKTPPCAEAIIKAKPAEIVVACLDPDKRINGHGIKMLMEAGIKVTLGIGEKKTQEINRGFFKRIKTGMPFVTLKAAISADGKYAKGTGKPVFITGDIARKFVHLLRSRNDVLITGTGTIKADNPQLNVRLNGMEDTSPQVVVLSKADLIKTLQNLAQNGINNVLIEAGPTLASAFIAAGLVDELIIIESPKILGKTGANYFAKNALKEFQKISQQQSGVDLISIYKTKK
jgi:diaminohydroxyphosphoribosylaminopyrimidine deaminase/5-amino-6-(5-phosphoribosylamino)uracil reductase